MVLKISKTFVFYLRTSDEYLTSYGQGYILMDPYPNFIKYLSDILKKKEVLDIINTNNFFFYENKCRIKSSEYMDPFYWRKKNTLRKWWICLCEALIFLVDYYLAENAIFLIAFRTSFSCIMIFYGNIFPFRVYIKSHTMQKYYVIFY